MGVIDDDRGLLTIIDLGRLFGQGTIRVGGIELEGGKVITVRERAAEAVRAVPRACWRSL